MRKVILLVALVMLVATPARAVPIVAENLDSVLLGTLIADSTDLFAVAKPPPLTMGVLDSQVYVSDLTGIYTYINTVTPTVDDASHLSTAFTVAGFTGAAGWSFSDAVLVGGTGTALDFLVADVGHRLHWLTIDRALGENWDAGEAIRFYFRSTRPPTAGDYNLLNSDAGTAVGFAPVPEPGTIMLLGSGVFALYARRRRQKQTFS